MKKRVQFLAILIILWFNIVVGIRAFNALGAEENEESGYLNIEILTRVMQSIRQDYVDVKKTSYRELVYNALRGMLSGLDPHSQFMEPQDLKSMQDDTRGDFGGIGVIVAVKDDMLTIVSPQEGSPAFKAGLLPGDQILKINGTSTEKMGLSDAVESMRGDIGRSITLTILRPSTRTIKDYTLDREKISVESIKDAHILPKTETGDYKIGYLRLTQFNSPTAHELKTALDKLTEEGMDAFILDLRYNPGGLLNSAVDVCGEFLPPHTKVVYTEGRLASQRKEYFTGKNYKPRPFFPMAILVNNGSASGSEIVAGALSDLKRAVLVGETTFGKGSVQSVIQLRDGSGIRLTTAKYYTPSAKVIHEHGVTPNIRVTVTPQQEREALLLLQRQYLSAEEQGRLSEVQDIVLDRAVDALKGLLIYDGKNDQPIRTAQTHQ